MVIIYFLILDIYGMLTLHEANKILTDHVASEFDKYFQMRDKSIESGVLFHLLILIPIICVVRFLFQFTQIAKSQITCKTLILVICGYQMMVCLLFYFFFFVSGIDPLILIQRHYANLLGIFVMTVMLSLIVLAGCFIILYWKLRYHNIISSLFGIGSITLHFYWCIFKPVLLDGRQLLQRLGNASLTPICRSLDSYWKYISYLFYNFVFHYHGFRTSSKLGYSPKRSTGICSQRFPVDCIVKKGTLGNLVAWDAFSNQRVRSNQNILCHQGKRRILLSNCLELK